MSQPAAGHASAPASHEDTMRNPESAGTRQRWDRSVMAGPQNAEGRAV